MGNTEDTDTNCHHKMKPLWQYNILMFLGSVMVMVGIYKMCYRSPLEISRDIGFLIEVVAFIMLYRNKILRLDHIVLLIFSFIMLFFSHLILDEYANAFLWRLFN